MATWVDKFKMIAQLIRKCCSIDVIVTVDHITNMLDGLWLCQCPFYLVLCSHADTVRGMKSYVQPFLWVKGSPRLALRAR